MTKKLIIWEQCNNLRTLEIKTKIHQTDKMDFEQNRNEIKEKLDEIET